MIDETNDLSKTLAWACSMVLHASPEDRQRIALAYHEAQDLVAGIPKDDGDARPRIVACLERSETYRAAENIACVGWVLTALQERINEQTLPDWRQLRKVINKTTKLLPPAKPMVH